MTSKHNCRPEWGALYEPLSQSEYHLMNTVHLRILQFQLWSVEKHKKIFIWKLNYSSMCVWCGFKSDKFISQSLIFQTSTLKAVQIGMLYSFNKPSVNLGHLKCLISDVDFLYMLSVFCSPFWPWVSPTWWAWLPASMTQRLSSWPWASLQSSASRSCSSHYRSAHTNSCFNKCI